jgi:hypothetical protein
MPALSDLLHAIRPRTGRTNRSRRLGALPIQLLLRHADGAHRGLAGGIARVLDAPGGMFPRGPCMRDLAAALESSAPIARVPSKPARWPGGRTIGDVGRLWKA